MNVCWCSALVGSSQQETNYFYTQRDTNQQRTFVLANMGYDHSTGSVAKSAKPITTHRSNIGLTETGGALMRKKVVCVNVFDANNHKDVKKRRILNKKKKTHQTNFRRRKRLLRLGNPCENHCYRAEVNQLLFPRQNLVNLAHRL